jgi:hypothetical protein
VRFVLSDLVRLMLLLLLGVAPQLTVCWAIVMSWKQSSDEREFRTARDYTAGVVHSVRSKALPRKQVTNEHDPTLNQPDKGSCLSSRSGPLPGHAVSHLLTCVCTRAADINPVAIVDPSIDWNSVGGLEHRTMLEFIHRLNADVFTATHTPS